MTEIMEDSNLVKHAQREMTLLGMGPDSEDINRMMYDSVIELVRVFSQQGHSGASASYCIGLTEKLMRFEPLSPLSDDTSEWEAIDSSMLASGSKPLWQSKRNPAAMSHDAGKTYWLVTEMSSSPETTPLYITEPRL